MYSDMFQQSRDYSIPSKAELQLLVFLSSAIWVMPYNTSSFIRADRITNLQGGIIDTHVFLIGGECAE